jgi:hypothetical protein
MTTFNPVVPPDVEYGVLEYLRDAIPSIVAGVVVPRDYDGSTPFLTVTAIGGTFDITGYGTTTFDIDAYGPDRASAGDLIRDACARLLIASYGPAVAGVAICKTAVSVAPQYVTDTIGGWPHWHAIAEITCRTSRIGS